MGKDNRTVSVTLTDWVDHQTQVNAENLGKSNAAITVHNTEINALGNAVVSVDNKVGATNTEVTKIKESITTVNTTLETKATKEEVNTLSSQLENVKTNLPSDLKLTGNKLQLKKSDGTTVGTGIDLPSGGGSLGENSVETINIKNKAITIEKTDFIKIGEPTYTNNIFDGSWDRNIVVLLDETENKLYCTRKNIASKCATIRLEQNTSYKIVIASNDRKKVGVINGELSSIPEYPEKIFFDTELCRNDSDTQEIIFKNTNGKYLILYLASKDSVNPNLKVFKGELTEGSMGFTFPVLADGIKGGISVKDTNFIVEPINLFNGKYYNLGLDESGTIWNNANYRTAIIKVERNRNYKIKCISNNTMRVSGASSIITSDNGKTTLIGDYGIKNTVVVNSKTHDYLYFWVSSIGENIDLRLFESSNENDIPFEDNIKISNTPIYIEQDIKNIITNNANKYYFVEDLKGIYNSPDLPSVANGQAFDLATSQNTTIIAKYDELLPNATGYMIKKVLGATSTGLEVVSYSLKPTRVTFEKQSHIKMPKIMIVAGTHGNEKMGVWSTYNFVKDLVTNFKSNPILEFIRYNCELIIVPILNPYGYNTNNRRNSNNVDLNRNFPYCFENTEFAEGTSALSEKESQYLYKLICENTDACALIDFHNMGATVGNNLIWFVSQCERYRTLYNNIIISLGRKWQKQHTSVFPQDDNIVFGHMNNSFENYRYPECPSIENNGNHLGIPSFSLEVGTQIKYGNEPLYGKLTTMCSVDVIGNTIVAILKNLK